MKNCNTTIITDKINELHGNIWNLEQYVFGFTRTYITVAVNDGTDTPFKIYEFSTQHTNTLRQIGTPAGYASRVTAFKIMSRGWLNDHE